MSETNDLQRYIDAYPNPQAGPCMICGKVNYPLSTGGPALCPSCDCGDFGVTVVERQGKEILDLRERLTMATENTKESFEGYLHRRLGDEYTRLTLAALDAAGFPPI
jgi:hypothetical protein